MVSHHVRCDSAAACRGILVEERRVAPDDLVDAEPALELTVCVETRLEGLQCDGAQE
jgi:hypothetical protein